MGLGGWGNKLIMNTLNYHLKGLEEKEEEGREREEERNTSSCTAMAKTSTGKDKEVPPAETRKGEMRKIIKTTSGEKGIADLSSFL